MGWCACGVKGAQQAADNGTAADEEDTVDEAAAVMTLSETTSSYAVADLQFYSYGYAPARYISKAFRIYVAII